ncbi:MAG: ABC transporter ATP-binding protein [Acholeplasmataceae bacterium]|nr:ABC transporter ATP-binding protein [Acholeplasmataceae bacterium]
MKYKVEMKNITKVFGTLVANDNVSIAIKPGEIYALLGENGAGKSTLMSILFGLYKPEKGEIYIDGSHVEINNPNDANRIGIGMVHQHFKLVETFTVLENIILGVEDVKKGILQYEDAIKKITELIETYHLNVDLNAYIKDITVGQQQRVEILKMLYRDSDILIFDEPTAVLTPQEIHELINIIKGFAKEGKTIILITHKLNEIKAVADTCTVLRRGKAIGTVKVKDVSVEKMAEMMVGREVLFTVKKDDITPGENIFKVENLSVEGKGKNLVNDVSFTVKQNEIVGIAGIDGNGQTELIHALTGLMPLHHGKVTLNDKEITKSNIRSKYEAGMSHIPEDRQKHGVIMDFDLQSNLILQNFYQSQYQKNKFLRFDAILQNAETLIDQFDIRSEGGPKTILRSMSGGNQQKAILGREMARDHDLLIAVQPTRGLDVGAIEYIHSQLLAERRRGKAILLVSLEIEEIMNLSDRILVMYEGEIVGELDPKKITINELGLYMSGAKRGVSHA